MPTYEYACSSCKNEWELEQSIKENAVTECPACHNQTAKRQISRGGGFILKGGGWYADLYSSSSNSAKPEGTKAEGSAGESGKGGSADAGKSESAKTETSKTADSGSSSSSDSSSAPSTAPKGPASAA